MVAVCTSLESGEWETVKKRQLGGEKQRHLSSSVKAILSFHFLRPTGRPLRFFTKTILQFLHFAPFKKMYRSKIKIFQQIPRAKTVLVYWYWMPKPTTTLPPSLGITPSCRPTYKQERLTSAQPLKMNLMQDQAIPCCFSSTEQPPCHPGVQQGPLLHHQIQLHRLLGEDTPGKLGFRMVRTKLRHIHLAGGQNNICSYQIPASIFCSHNAWLLKGVKT